MPTTIDKKAINLNLRTNPKAAAPATAPPKASSTTPTSKKIDLGAASHYGKAPDLGINSPTHRNTHSEDLFGLNNNEQPTADEMIFKTVAATHHDEADDFNPRAAEDFGDFETAFGGGQRQAPKSNGKTDEFADFAAFSTPVVAAAAPPPPPSSTDLFGSFGAAPDLFAAPSVVPKSQPNDLLSDLGGLSLGSGKNILFSFSVACMRFVAFYRVFFKTL